MILEESTHSRSNWDQIYMATIESLIHEKFEAQSPRSSKKKVLLSNVEQNCLTFPPITKMTWSML